MSVTLNAYLRQRVGSRAARRLRVQGRIPANIQGEGKQDLNVALEEEPFLAARRHHEQLFDLEFSDHDPETVMVRELQWDGLGERILHIEFRRVTRGVKISAQATLQFEGHPKGGILNQLVTQVGIRSIPSLVPDAILVNVDHMTTAAPLLAGELELPEGVELDMPEDTQLAVVSVPRGEVEATPEAEAEAAAEAEAEAVETPAEPEG
jgi:large subunit ribosomal protein L25